MSSTQPNNGYVLRTLRGRRPIPILQFLVVAAASMIFAVLALQNPLINESLLAVMLLTALFLIVIAFIVMNVNDDALDAFRVMSVFYLLCFCISPLFVVDLEWHFSRPLGPLAEKAILFLIVGYLLTAAGYYLPFFRPIPAVIEIGELRGNPLFLKLLGLVLFAIGELCLLIVYVRAGGVERMIGGEESRVSFSWGLGLFLWPALFTVPGGVLYFAAKARPDLRFAWVHSWPLWFSAASWIVFQARIRVLNLVVMALLVGHYVVRRIRISRVAIYGTAGFVFAGLVGFARSPEVRYLLILDPGALFSAFGAQFWEISHATLTGSFSRLQMIMIILDKVPAWEPYDWGSTFFMIFNPLLRLTGLGQYQFDGIGHRLFNLAHPEVGGMLETGYLPSLPGEFLWNFPFYIAIFLFPLYGIALRAVYSRLILRNADPSSVALYTILMLALVNMIHASCGQNLFEMLVVWLPALGAIKLAQLAMGQRQATIPPLELSPGSSTIGTRPGDS
jgi:hypothetical protein